MDAELLFRRIKRALDEVDIEGLLELGAPSDEYDLEARSILEGVTSSDSNALPEVEQVQRIVADVWQSKFGLFDQSALARRKSQFALIAKKIVCADESV